MTETETPPGLTSFQRSYLELLRELVELESPSHEPEAVEKLLTFIEGYFEAVGVAPTRIPNAPFADCLLVEAGSRPTDILLLCHVDTVWPLGEVEKRPFTVAGDMVTGPGVTDMKSGVALAMQLIRRIAENAVEAVHRVRLLLTTDEEVGSPSSRSLIEHLARDSAAVLVFEPGYPDGSVKTSRKGWGHFSLEVSGVGAHAGSDHALGRSAVRELARQVIRLEEITDYTAGVTVNVGVVRGGRERNTVPDSAYAEIDLRVPTDEHFEQAIGRIMDVGTPLDGTTVDVSGEINRPAFVRTEAVARLYDHVRELGQSFGFEVGEVGMGGVSDGNFTAALGVPTLDGLGLPGAGAHALNEFADLSGLEPRSTLLDLLVSSPLPPALAARRDR